MLLSSFLLALVLFMRFGPDVPFRLMLNKTLVEQPLVWVAKKERHEFLYLIIVFAMLFGAGEVVLMMGPEFIMGFAADLALYLDIVAATYLMRALTQIKAAVRAVRLRLSSLRGHVARLCRTDSRQRAPRKRSRSRADNDDEDSAQLMKTAA